MWWGRDPVAEGWYSTSACKPAGREDENQRRLLQVCLDTFEGLGRQIHCVWSRAARGGRVYEPGSGL
jgi:hypothetical protein